MLITHVAYAIINIRNAINDSLTRGTLQVTIILIKPFVHKGLEEYYYFGSKKGIQAGHAAKLSRILDRLDASTCPQDMNLPGFRLHQLTGNKKDIWSVSVNGNWRVTFYFKGIDAYLVDYLDYH